MLILVFILAAAALVFAVVAGRGAARRRRLMARPIPAEWQGWLQANVPLYRMLPAQFKAQLHADMNVVLHEFAHQLDQEDGASHGAPILERRSSYVAWARVLGESYEALREAVARHKPDVMDSYGTTNPAEFFAVATEVFFEKPSQMKAAHPALFDELRSYYRLDPLAWREGLR